MKKKLLSKIGKALIVIVAVVGLILLGIFIWHTKATRDENALLQQAYGKMITVADHQMCVEIAGEGKDVIVLLPGFNAVSPVLEMKGLISELKEKYTVVVIEPLGYGLSDGADKPRTVENISSEIHEALEVLGYKKYILMAHSLSGIYSLYYAQQYPDEVVAYVGIDSSVPGQLEVEEEESIGVYRMISRLNRIGIYRLLAKVDQQGVVPEIKDHPFSDYEKKVYQALFFRNLLNQTALEEYQLSKENMNKTKEMTFSDTTPVLFFLSSENCESDAKWEAMHEAIITRHTPNEIMQLEGGHYLHEIYAKRIAQAFSDWYEMQKNTF